MMKNFLKILFLSFALQALLFTISAASAEEVVKESQLLKNNKCLSCHQEAEVLPEDYNPNDIHLQVGLTCAGCHGGDPHAEDPDEAMSPEKGFVGVPSRTDIPKFCGKCHSNIQFMRNYNPQMETDQVRQYYTSIHGQRLKKGDEKVATCVDCHTAHSILPPSDPRSTVYPVKVPYTCKKCHSDPKYMKPYGLPTDQFDKYAKSVHGVALLKNKDVAAAACNDCHGNHGARPPGAKSIAQICGQCHPNNMNYFIKTPMAKAYRSRGLHDCVVCHNHHDIRKPTDDMVGTQPPAVCIRCHTPQSKGFHVADSLHKALTELSQEIQLAKREQLEIQRKGLDDVDIDYLIKEAYQNLVHARTLVHTFSGRVVQNKTKEGVKKAKDAITMAVNLLNEFNKTKWTFLGLTFFTTVLIVGLIFRLREIEKGKQSTKED